MLSVGEELVRTYVPEAQFLTYDEAIALAERRDEQAADDLVASCSAA